MKSTRSKVSGRSNYRLFLSWIVATSCLGTVTCSPLLAQLPSGLPPASLPAELPATLPPASLPGLPSALPSKALEQPAKAAIPKPGFALPAPPSAGVPKSSGAVQVRLGTQPTQLPEPPRMPSTALSTPIAAPTSNSSGATVSIAIDTMESSPSKVVEQSNLPQQGSAPAPATLPQGPVKFSLGDDGVVDLGIQRTLNPPTLVQRAPEVVRPKKYSVSQVVTVAADADLTAEPPTLPVPSTVQPVVPQPVDLVSSEFVPAPLPPEAAPALPMQPRAIPKPSAPKASSGPVSASGTATAAAIPTQQTTRSVNVERTFDIEVLGTYTIDPSIPVASVAAQDPETCNVFHNGRMITVVGNKVGSTVVEIRGVDQSVRSIGVKVLPTGRLHASAPTELDKVKGMISQHFPTAKLSFTQQSDGGIQVKGTATSESDARRILELVRKLCLVPIYDQIKVAY